MKLKLYFAKDKILVKFLPHCKKKLCPLIILVNTSLCQCEYTQWKRHIFIIIKEGGYGICITGDTTEKLLL